MAGFDGGVGTARGVGALTDFGAQGCVAAGFAGVCLDGAKNDCGFDGVNGLALFGADTGANWSIDGVGARLGRLPVRTLPTKNGLLGLRTEEVVEIEVTFPLGAETRLKPPAAPLVLV